ncbi:hypothetical protein ACFC36_35475 [Streptomyces rubiginosohelvolus]|uniref:hypothetical protein n=1 Tax=Streptomyces rubiginosohelvolus TaxID=67362 RepID=UPI0035D6479C
MARVGESSKARELYDALRALEDKARAGYGRKAGHAYSRRALAEAVDGRGSSLDRRLAVWLHDDWGSAKTPKLSSSEKLIAVVRQWSAWAGERCDEGWWRTLLDQAQPHRSPLPSARVQERGDESYAAWVEDHILSAQLVDREDELQELAEFCSGPDLPGASAYWWWQAPPWAGKSALVADFALRHRPDTVEVVSCFITDRLSRNDQSVFLETVMRQLALIAQREVGAVGRRPEDLPGLCRAAAEACRNRGRRLVLIVDGLDEDQGAASGGPSIAALLPRVPPAGMRVVVTSRPTPSVPDDVPDDHPLRARDVIRTLTPWSHATGLSVLARHELRRLLDDEAVGVPLLGLLVTASGGLTSADLARLVGVRPYRVDRLLRGITGRSFVAGSHGQVLVPVSHATPHVHALGHEELRQEALTALGDVTGFERQLHEWATGYRDREWPSDTPSYLLYDYPRMLHSVGDLKRLTDIALDPHRQRALMERASLDTAFTHIELTAQLVRRQSPEDLVELTALAASSAVLAERARALPAGVPLTFARLGHARRAMDLAFVAPFPAEKAVRLARVARVLVEVGDRLAAEAASEAARWAERARRESAPPSGDEQEAEEATGEAAVALMAVGALYRGRELLGQLGASANAGDEAGATVVARAAVAARFHDPVLAEELLDQAEQYSEELAAASPADPSAPIAAWAACAAATEGPRADRMYERISQYAQAFPPRLTACFVHASAASALATVRPEQANTLAGQAAGRLEAALGDPEGLSDDDGGDLTMLLSHMLTTVVRALVDTGSVDRARGLVARVPEKRHTGLMGIDTLAGARAVLADDVDEPPQEPSAHTLAEHAFRLADRGERDEASRRLSQALEALSSPQEQGPRRLLPRETWLIPLCAALSAIGQQGDGAQLARSLRDPVEQVQALAAAAASASRAGHLDDARRLAYEAADRTRTLEGADNFSFFDGAPGRDVADAKGAAAQALAHVGERERALALADETGPEDHDRRHRTLVAIAAALRSYDPATAVDLIDRQRERLLTPDPHRGWSGRIADLSELLTAIADADAGCADRLHQAAEHVAQQLKESDTWLDTEDLLTVLLLHAREEPDDARSTLTSWEQKSTGSAPWGLPTGAIAIAHAALGNLDAARHRANRHNVPYDRAEAFAAVAGYLTPIASGIRVISASTSTAFTETFRTLALILIPPDTAETVQKARQFAASALAGDGWHCALPALACLAPAAIERVKDIVFTHRRLPLPNA